MRRWRGAEPPWGQATAAAPSFVQKNPRKYRTPPIKPRATRTFAPPLPYIQIPGTFGYGLFGDDTFGGGALNNTFQTTKRGTHRTIWIAPRRARIFGVNYKALESFRFIPTSIAWVGGTFTIQLVGLDTSWSIDTTWTVTESGVTLGSSSFAFVNSGLVNWSFTLGAGAPGTLTVSDGLGGSATLQVTQQAFIHPPYARTRRFRPFQRKAHISEPPWGQSIDLHPILIFEKGPARRRFPKTWQRRGRLVTPPVTGLQQPTVQNNATQHNKTKWVAPRRGKTTKQILRGIEAFRFVPVSVAWVGGVYTVEVVGSDTYWTDDTSWTVIPSPGMSLSSSLFTVNTPADATWNFSLGPGFPGSFTLLDGSGAFATLQITQVAFIPPNGQRRTRPPYVKRGHIIQIPLGQTALNVNPALVFRSSQRRTSAPYVRPHHLILPPWGQSANVNNNPALVFRQGQRRTQLPYVRPQRLVLPPWGQAALNTNPAFVPQGRTHHPNLGQAWTRRGRLWVPVHHAAVPLPPQQPKRRATPLATPRRRVWRPIVEAAHRVPLNLKRRVSPLIKPARGKLIFTTQPPPVQVNPLFIDVSRRRALQRFWVPVPRGNIIIPGTLLGQATILFVTTSAVYFANDELVTVYEIDELQY